MMTNRQVALLRQRRMEGKTQETAAAMAGMSVRSARKWQRGPLPSETKTGRSTRCLRCGPPYAQLPQQHRRRFALRPFLHCHRGRQQQGLHPVGAR